MKLIQKLLIIGLLSTSVLLYGQKTPKIHEVGLGISSNLNFAMTYKTGAPDKLFRLTTLYLNGVVQQQADKLSHNHGGGIKLGAEFRKPIVNNLWFTYGFDVGFRYQNSTSTDSGPGQLFQNAHQLSPSVNALLGVTYVLKERWLFSLELCPYFSYTHTFQENSVGAHLHSSATRNRFAYGMDLGSVQFLVSYRFSKA